MRKVRYNESSHYANAEILLTGDKDFLESGLENPKIMTAIDFVQSDC